MRSLTHLRRLPREAARLLLIACALCIGAGWIGASSATVLAATSAARLLDSANARYLEGDLDAAREAYQQVLELQPDAAAIHYGLGNLAHRAEKYDEAAERYRDALTRLRGEEGLERKILYNLGNNAFRQGMAQAEAEPEKALEVLETAAGYYRDVIERTRELAAQGDRKIELDKIDAAYNLEVVRIRIKEILDRINQEEEEQPEQPPDLTKMVLAWLDEQRELVSMLETSRSIAASRDDLQEKLFESFVASQTSIQEKGNEIRAELDKRLAAAQAPAAGGAPGGAPGGPMTGAAPGGPAAMPQQGPPPEALEAALSRFDAVEAMQQEVLDELAENVIVTAGRAAERALDPMSMVLTAVEPLRGLERRTLIALEAEQRIRAGTEALQLQNEQGKDGPFARDDVEASQAGNLARTGSITGMAAAFLTQAQQQAEQQAAQQQGTPQPGSPQPGTPQTSSPQPGTPQPGTPQPGSPPPGADVDAAAPGPMQELLDVLTEVRDETGLASEQQTIAAGHLSEDRYVDAQTAEDQAIVHLEAAHERINDFLKNWIDWLADAVKNQTEIVSQTQVAAQVIEAGDDSTEITERTLAKQIDNLDVTERALTGLQEELMQAQMAADLAAQQAAAQGGQPGGAPGTPGGAPGVPGMPGGGGPDPTLLEVKTLIEEGMAAEQEARSFLEAPDPAAAYDPAELARKKLAEALEKANQNQGQDQQQQDQEQDGDNEQQDEGEQSDEGEENDEQNEDEQQPPEDQEDQQNEQEQQQEEEQQDEESKPQEQLTPQEAMSKLLQMMQEQERSRERLRERFGTKREDRPKVEKDW